jgi:hypothetical protein
MLDTILEEDHPRIISAKFVLLYPGELYRLLGASSFPLPPLKKTPSTLSISNMNN